MVTSGSTKTLRAFAIYDNGSVYDITLPAE